MTKIHPSILFGWALSLGPRKIRFLSAKPTREELEFIGMLAKEGKIRSVIDRQFPLEKTAEAFRYLTEGQATGKILVKVQ